MKILSLNTWGGRIHKPLLEFFKEQQEVDIFCLQEIYHEAEGKETNEEFLGDAFDLFSTIKNALPNHEGYFRPSIGDYYGLAMFVKKDITLTSEGDITIYDVANYAGDSNHSRNLQYVSFKQGNNDILIANVHGLWNGKGKTDTPERIGQSEKIRQFIDAFEGEKVVCGDFNLAPDTQSLGILEPGMKNLIKEYGISSTRTSLYTKPEKFADYAFVSSGIEVKDFKVLPDEVSDHSPLYLDLDLI